MRFDTWAEFLEHQRRQPYMRQISDFVKAERQCGPVYPWHPLTRRSDTGSVRQCTTRTLYPLGHESESGF